jgi:iron complex outermembrane receptor protein
MLTENNPNRRMVLDRNPNFHGELYPREGEPDDAAAGLLKDAGKPMPFIDRAVYSLEPETIPYWNKFLQGYYDVSGIGSDNFDQAITFGGRNQPELTDEMRARGLRLLTAVAPSISYTGFNMNDPVVGGDFATPQEHDYLFDTRDFDTKYQQTVYSLYANGDIFQLPGGTAKFGLGAEYRIDKIDSKPDEVARDGLFFGFFSDGGAVGSKFTREYFTELELPLVAGHTGMEELTVNMSARHTTDEYYGSAWTYSGKLAYRPVDSLLLRGTVGTSYRAPNLREYFLQSQTGFLNLTDPCVIPEQAWDSLTNTYNPALDPREAQVLTNCVANGVDPTTFYNNGISVYSTEVSAGGATDINEETSKSYSAGFTWDQPFFSSFDLVFGLTYYSIDIKDEIIEPSAGFIVHDCYYDPEGNSPFCSRIVRDPTTYRFDIVNQGFINRDSKKARGVDLNMSVDIPSTMFGRAVDWGMDFAFNHQIENRDTFIDDDGVRSETNYAGQFAYPNWKGRVAVRADIGDWRATWSMRYISGVAEAPADVDPWGGLADGSDTCLGAALGDVDCRDVGSANNYFTHDVSVYYRGDTWTFGAGVRNLFNEWPPQVDGSEVFAINNTPYGAGYDMFGRQVFLNVVYNLQTQ